METIIAFDGGNRYLVSFNGEWESAKGDLNAMGQVIDTSADAKMQPFRLHALINAGEWRPFVGTPEMEIRILATGSHATLALQVESLALAA